MDNNSRFERQIQQLTVKAGSKGNILDFFFNDRSGATVPTIFKLESSCGCTTPLMYNDKIQVTYNNSTDLQGAVMSTINPEWITVYSKKEGVPTYIKNEQNVDIVNPELDFEYLKIEINVTQ